jgi:O-antigen ligase
MAASVVTSAWAISSGTSIDGGRLTGGISDPNYLAAELALALVAGGFLLGTTDRLALRAALVAAIVVDAVAFVMTQSRGGIAGLAVGTVAAVIVAGRARTTVVAVIALVAAAAVCYFALVAPARIEHRVTDFSSSASSGRSDLWRIAFRMGSAHPVQGVALGGFRQKEASYVFSGIQVQDPRYVLEGIVVHNTFLETFAELGAVGFVLILLVVTLPLLAAWGALKQIAATDDRVFANATRGLVAGACALLGGYVFVSAEYEKTLWIVLGLLAGTATVAARERHVRLADATATSAGRGQGRRRRVHRVV